MKKVSEKIDQWAEENYGTIRHNFFGFCDLVKRNDQPMPSTVPDKKQVALDNNFDLITWQRLSTQIETSSDENFSYGKKIAKKQTADLRYVIAVKASLGEEFIIEFNDSLPGQLIVPDYKYVFVTEARIVDADHESVYNTELGETEYEKHRFAWNIYAILLKIEMLNCK